MFIHDFVQLDVYAYEITCMNMMHLDLKVYGLIYFVLCDITDCIPH